MKSKLQFITVCENNIARFTQGISDLHYVRHKQRHDPAYWQWRYLSGPAGLGSLIIAVRNDKVVGQYGVSYLLLSLKGELMIAGLMGSLAIDPAEKSWQCYRGLVNQSMMASKQKKLVFRFGLAPLRTIRFTQRMGVKRLGRIPLFFGLLNAQAFLQARDICYPACLLGNILQPLFGLRNDIRINNELSIQKVDDFGLEFDQLWADIARDNYNGYLKNSAYLQWRYQQCPVRKYYKLAAYKNNKLEGFIVFCLTGIRNSACVLELIARKNNLKTMRDLLFAACNQLRAEKIGSITASFLPNTATAEAALALGFKFWPGLLSNSQMIMAANTIETEYTEQDFRTCEFSLGDWLEF